MDMTALVLLLLPLAFSLKYGAEDRPGFDERAPLA